jgi:hypothetical protein
VSFLILCWASYAFHGWEAVVSMFSRKNFGILSRFIYSKPAASVSLLAKKENTKINTFYSLYKRHENYFLPSYALLYSHTGIP